MKSLYYHRNKSIKSKQGIEVSGTGGINYDAAGNGFSYTGIDFSNFGSSIEYFFNSSGQNEEPFTVEGAFSSTAAGSNTCLSDYCEPPCKTKEEIKIIKNDFYTHRAAFQTATSAFTTAPSEDKVRQMAYHRRIMDEEAYTVVIHTLYDTTNYDVDTLRIWIGNLGSLEGDLWLANEQLRGGNFSLALSLLTETTTKHQLDTEKSADIESYTSVTWLLNGLPLYALDKTTLESLKGYIGTKGSADGWVENILTLYGAHFPVTCELSGGSEERNNKSGKAKLPQWVSVQPNPAKDFVQFVFSLPDNVENISLRIIDVNARTVKVQDSRFSFGAFFWDTVGCAAGIYFYQVIANGKIEQSGKIILNK